MTPFDLRLSIKQIELGTSSAAEDENKHAEADEEGLGQSSGTWERAISQDRGDLFTWYLFKKVHPRRPPPY